MSDLIDPNTNHWDVDLVRQTFWQVDVQRIVGIRLSSSAMQDFVAWNLTRTNTFSVRSAYYAEWEGQYGQRLNIGHQAFGIKPHPIWDKIWGLKVAPKVKIFLWRVMHNTIPCRVTLANRHIKVRWKCIVCGIGA